jgi:hypothetical protein
LGQPAVDGQVHLLQRVVRVLQQVRLLLKEVVVFGGWGGVGGGLWG